MKEFNELPMGIQTMIEGYAINDPYGLKPSTLYKNIAGSTGPAEQVAKIFEVSLSLVEMIREQNEG